MDYMGSKKFVRDALDNTTPFLVGPFILFR